MVANSNITILKMSDDAFLCWSCLRPYHQELLPILNQQIDKLIKLTEWRICDDNIVMTIIYILKSYALVSLRIISGTPSLVFGLYPLTLIERIPHSSA